MSGEYLERHDVDWKGSKSEEASGEEEGVFQAVGLAWWR